MGRLIQEHSLLEREAQLMIDSDVGPEPKPAKWRVALWWLSPLLGLVVLLGLQLACLTSAETPAEKMKLAEGVWIVLLSIGTTWLAAQISGYQSECSSNERPLNV